MRSCYGWFLQIALDILTLIFDLNFKSHYFVIKIDSALTRVLSERQLGISGKVYFADLSRPPKVLPPLGFSLPIDVGNSCTLLVDTPLPIVLLEHLPNPKRGVLDPVSTLHVRLYLDLDLILRFDHVPERWQQGHGQHR